MEEEKLNNDNVIRIQQVPWSLNQTLASKVTCLSSPPCKIRYYLGYETERSAMMLVDNKNKILLEIVPKADCSGASVMFFQNVGFHYGVEYNGWPHHFRKKYFYNRCGRATPCMMYDTSYYRFKIVRNPFSRVVSENRKKITFNHFIEILKQLNNTELQHYGQGHCSYQSQPYERDNYGKKDIVIYHSYVHAEDSDHQLQQINQLIGSNFSLTNIIREVWGAVESRTEHCSLFHKLLNRDIVVPSYGSDGLVIFQWNTERSIPSFGKLVIFQTESRL
eukprot:gene5391-5784_t